MARRISRGSPESGQGSPARTRRKSPNSVHVQVSRDVDVSHVEAIPVGSRHTVPHQLDRVIGEDSGKAPAVLDRSADNTQASRARAHDGLDFIGRGRSPDIESERTQFRLFQFVTPSQNNGERLPVTDEHQGLELIGRSHPVGSLFQSGDRGHARGGELFDLASWSGVLEICGTMPLVAFSRLAA